MIGSAENIFDGLFLFTKKTLLFDKREKVSLLFFPFVKSYYKFYPLATKRLTAETILLFKVLNEFIDCPQLLSLIKAFHTHHSPVPSSYSTVRPSSSDLPT